MTVEEVEAMVAYVEQLKGDDEAAHGEEDMVWLGVLIAIANGAPNAAQLAAVAIRTRDIVFFRWYA